MSGYVDGRVNMLGTLRALAMQDALSIRGLQTTYSLADEASVDARLPPATREDALWLRDQVDAELTVREFDG